MASYVFSYRSPKGYIQGDERAAAAWYSWFEAISGDVVEMGRPVFERGSLGTVGSEETALGGYSIIRADDLESALAVAKGCPILGAGGGVEVGELAEIPSAGGSTQ